MVFHWSDGAWSGLIVFFELLKVPGLFRRPYIYLGEPHKCSTYTVLHLCALKCLVIFSILFGGAKKSLEPSEYATGPLGEWQKKYDASSIQYYNFSMI